MTAIVPNRPCPGISAVFKQDATETPESISGLRRGHPGFWSLSLGAATLPPGPATPPGLGFHDQTIGPAAGHGCRHSRPQAKAKTHSPNSPDSFDLGRAVVLDVFHPRLYITLRSEHSNRFKLGNCRKPVTLLEPRHSAHMGGSLPIALSHAAYSDPNLPGSKSRNVLESGAFMDGNLRKACIASENSPRPDNPLLRIPLHKIVLAMTSDKGGTCCRLWKNIRIGPII